VIVRSLSVTAVSDPEANVEEVARERRTSPVELFWDLVFAFAVTQAITLLTSHRLTWTTFWRAMLVLALVWWAWSAFVWVVNAFDDEELLLRVAMLGALLFIFLAGLALPRAFTDRGELFAGTYAVVRLIHLALYAEASRRGQASWSSIMGFAVTVLIGIALLIVGSLLATGPRTVLWILAAAIDYAGPALLGRRKLRGLQRVAVAHFAERYGQFVLICLGESIAAIGVSAAAKLDAHVLVLFVLCLLTTIGLWWTYFDELADAAYQRLRRQTDAVLAATDAYSLIHLLLVAGIVTFAVGTKLAITSRADGQLALCGGVAVYLLGQAAFAWRMVGSPGATRALIAIVLLALCSVADHLATWVAAAIPAALLGALCVNEARLTER
jgi:low temperature requirement protein LtrA